MNTLAFWSLLSTPSHWPGGTRAWSSCGPVLVCLSGFAGMAQGWAQMKALPKGGSELPVLCSYLKSLGSSHTALLGRPWFVGVAGMEPGLQKWLRYFSVCPALGLAFQGLSNQDPVCPHFFPVLEHSSSSPSL